MRPLVIPSSFYRNAVTSDEVYRPTPPGDFAAIETLRRTKAAFRSPDETKKPIKKKLILNFSFSEISFLEDWQIASFLHQLTAPENGFEVYYKSPYGPISSIKELELGKMKHRFKNENTKAIFNTAITQLKIKGRDLQVVSMKEFQELVNINGQTTHFFYLHDMNGLFGRFKGSFFDDLFDWLNEKTTENQDFQIVIEKIDEKFNEFFTKYFIPAPKNHEILSHFIFRPSIIENLPNRLTFNFLNERYHFIKDLKKIDLSHENIPVDSLVTLLQNATNADTIKIGSDFVRFYDDLHTSEIDLVFSSSARLIEVKGICGPDQAPAVFKRLISCSKNLITLNLITCKLDILLENVHFPYLKKICFNGICEYDNPHGFLKIRNIILYNRF